MTQPNPYLDLLQAQGSAPAGGGQAPANPYLDVLQRADEARRTALSGQLTQAVSVNPEQYTAQRRAAQYLGYPTAAVEAQPELVDVAKVKQIQQDTARAPVLQTRYTDADFAKLAHDDAPTLAKIEQTIGNITSYVMGATPSGGLPGDFKRGIYDQSSYASSGFFRMVSDGAAAVTETVIPGVKAWEGSGNLGGNPLRRLAEGFGLIAQSTKQRMDAEVGAPANNIEAGVQSGVQSAGQMVKYLPLAFAGPPGWAAALGGMVAEQGGATYQGDLEKGVGQGTATVHAGADMLAEYVGERYFGEVGFLKQLAAGSPVSKLMTYELTRELPSEIGTTLWQNFNDWALTNPDKPVSEFLSEQPDAIVQTAIATLVGGSIQAGTGRTVVKVTESLLNRQMEITEALQREEALKQLVALAGQAKLGERSPEQLKAFMAEAASDAKVRFDAATLVDVFNQAGADLGQVLPSVNQQELGEMAASGGEVAVPLAELVAGTRGTGIENTVLEHARLGENTLSAAEARDVQSTLDQVLTQEAQRVIQQAQDQAATQASADAVRASILGELNAAGRFRSAVNEQYATWLGAFYTTMAARTGVTPEEFYNRYRLRIRGAAAGQGGALEQGGLWHGSSDPTWIDRGEAFDPARTATAPSKYLFLSPRREVAETYAGVSEMQRWKAENGMGKPPAPTAGVREFNAARGAKILKVVDVKKAAQKLGVEWAGENPLETLLDAAKAAGYDAARMEMDGGNVAVLNPAKFTLAGRGEVLEQGVRGTFNPQTLELVLSPNADLSTFFHETGHFFLEALADMAARPDAPAQVAEDWGKVLKWFGVTPEQWAAWQQEFADSGNTRLPEGLRAVHERWAESIEQYVMEGKAPSAELQPLMRRFAAWLKSIYGSIKQFLAARGVAADPVLGPGAGQVATGNPDQPAAAQTVPQLNDDIRRVMDRMLATDEQIAEANEAAGLVPDLDADAEAAERLNRRSLADLKWAVKARDKVIAKLRRQARTIEKAIREQVVAEVEQMPEVRAKAELDTLRKAKTLDDTSMAVVADSFGYDSADAMLKAIDAFGNKADVIDGITQRRMLEEHGDLVDERAIKEAANDAVHNDARARSLATELRTQGEMLNVRADTGETNAAGRKVTVNVLVEAAKQFGANVVARTPLRDLKNAAWRHTQAERRAADAWRKATAAGKTAEAVKAKQDQVLQHAAARAAIDARAEAAKVMGFFKRVVKDGDEKTVEKGRDPDIVNAARAVLAAYGVETKSTKAAADYLETVQRNDPETYNVIAPMVNAALQNAQPLDALTFSELQALHEEVQSLWHLAKRSRQMEVDGDLMDIEDAAQEIHARLEEIGIPDTIPGETGALTKAEERTRMLQFAAALMRRVEQWSEKMDGKFGGPFLRLVFQPIKDAATRYKADHIAYREKFQGLVDRVAPSMTHRLIEAPEIGYTFGRGHNGIGHAELLHAILHTGNESNKRKLLLGRGWATELPDGTLDTGRWDSFIKRLSENGTLNRAHYDFAQGVWDLLESTKPLAQKAHRDVFGRYFAEVTADPFVDPFGVERRGGYVPAQADPTIVADASLRSLAEMENENMAYSFPTTSKGFTKSRVEYNRPLKLDLRTLPQHIDKVLLFSHMEPAVRGVAKLLRQKRVSQPLNRIEPAAYDGMLLPWLNRSARQQVETPIVGDGRMARVLSALRARSGAALMFANVSNTVQQITGLSSAAVKVKPGALLRASAQYLGSPKRTTAAVTELSEYMRTRMDNSVAALDDTVKEILTKPGLYERAQDWSRRHAYFLQAAFDNVLSPIVWTGAYNDALTQGMDERMAVRFADGVVRQTQGALAAEDVSRIETGPAYARMFTQFASYWNMLGNTNATALQQIANEVGLKAGAGRALYVVTMGLLAPIWVAEAIAVAFKGGPGDADDDGDADTLVDWLAAVLGMGTIKGLLAQVPFVGQLANAGINRFNSNPADDRMSMSPAVGLLESAAGVPYDFWKHWEGEGNARRTVRDVASLVSLTTGLPATAVARPLGYWAGVADDRIEPTGPVDAARGTITGVPSEASKQR